MVELDDELYPSSVEVCLRVKPGTSRDFAEHLMKLSANQLSVGNLFILKVHDYEDLWNDFQQGSYNQVQVRFWMMGFLLLNILLGIVGTFWFRTQHRRAESALRIAVGASRMQLWQRLNKEGLLLLTLAALPAAVICYNIGHLELTEGYMEWGESAFSYYICHNLFPDVFNDSRWHLVSCSSGNSHTPCRGVARRIKNLGYLFVFNIINVSLSA